MLHLGAIERNGEITVSCDGLLSDFQVLYYMHVISTLTEEYFFEVRKNEGGVWTYEYSCHIPKPEELPAHPSCREFTGVVNEDSLTLEVKGISFHIFCTFKASINFSVRKDLSKKSKGKKLRVVTRSTSSTLKTNTPT